MMGDVTTRAFGIETRMLGWFMGMRGVEWSGVALQDVAPHVIPGNGRTEFTACTNTTGTDLKVTTLRSGC